MEMTFQFRQVELSSPIFIQMHSKKLYFLLTMAMSLLAIYSYPQDCNCTNNLVYLKAKVEANYAGFEDKVTYKNRERYNDFYKKILKASSGKKDIACFYLLNRYISWFRDGHLSLSINMRSSDTMSVRNFFKLSPKLDLNTVKISQNKNKIMDPIEGTWELQSNSFRYKVLILSNKRNRFTGVVLSADSVYWMPGQIKFQIRRKSRYRYQVTYLLRTHDIVYEDVDLSDPSQMLVFGNVWTTCLLQTHFILKH
jgi:hypothetical protein